MDGYDKHIMIYGITHTYESMCLDLKRKPVETYEMQMKHRIIIDSNIRV